MKLTGNMGTPAHPEGLPHFTNKALLAQRLSRSIEAFDRDPMPYAGALSSQLRNVSLSPDSPQLLKDALLGTDTTVGYVDRLNPLGSPFWFVVHYEQPHDACEGGLIFNDLLRDHRGGRVAQEEPWRNFIPDIAIYRPGADDPSSVIEVTATNPSSDSKLRAYRKAGVSAYNWNVRDNPQEAIATPMLVEPLVEAIRCGKRQRDRIASIHQDLADAQRPYYGIKTTSGGSLQYQYGDAGYVWPDMKWQYGDPLLRGVIRLYPGDPAPQSAPDIRPLWSRSLDRNTFLDLLMNTKTQIFIHGPQRGDQVTLRHIDDLLQLESGGRAAKQN